MTASIASTAKRIAAEHRDGTNFHTLEGLADLAAAYQVQKLYVGDILGSDRIAGYKIEFEICARLGRDLPLRTTPYTREEVTTAVDAVCAAIELVDDRKADYATLDCRSLVADNSWNAGVILGAFVVPPSALDEVVGVAYQDGIEIGRGKGADALGHPFEPLVWLANHLAGQGEGLKKGDIVMTGSIVTTRFPEAAFSYRFEVTGLGSVEVSGA